jgi:hypothetical protein
MNYAHEYALLVAVAAPALAIVGINVRLWLAGERGTLLVPSAGAFPTVIDRRELVAPATVQTAAQQALQQAVSANDARMREAA